MLKTNHFKKLVEIVTSEKKEVYNIYIFAIFSGIIQLSLPLGVQSIIGFVLGGTFSTSLIVLISLVISGVLFSGILQIQQMKIVEKIQQKIYHRYAFIFKKNLIDVDIQKGDNVYFPEIMNRFLDVTTLQKGISKILLDIPIATIQIFLGLIIVAIYHPLFLVLVVIMLVIIITVFYLTSKKGLETSIKESSYKYATASWLEEIARLIYHFKIQRIHKLSGNKIDEKIANYLDYRTKHFKILLFQYKNLVFLKIMITATMLIVGTYLLLNQQLNVGQFVAAELIILTMISSVEKIIQNLETFYDLLTSLDKLHTIENQDKEINGTQKFINNNRGMSIGFSNVSYSYLDNNKIFENLNFTINSGETIVISGKDGSGKSTLLRLISSLYNPSEGNIMYNNLPIKNLELDEFRANIGLMLNRLDIFNGTILENITFGNKAIQFEVIFNYAKQIGLEEFINNLPLGFETHIETTGKNLPRSVIKKILLLRAVVSNPELILLEEPFSDLEELSITKIQLFLINNFKNSTKIIVDNDKEFIKKCDRNFYLNNNQLQIISNQ